MANAFPHHVRQTVLMSTGFVAELPTIEHVKTEFMADGEARKLKESTLDRYRIIFRQLEAFAKAECITALRDLNTRR